MAEITHACIFNLELDDFQVVKLNDFVRLDQPKTYKDFEKYNAYTIRDGKKFVDVEIVAVGDLHQMEVASNMMCDAKITHAVVEFVKDFEYKVIEICKIQEFQRFVPEYKTRFYPLKTYHATCDNKLTFQDVIIHAFGDETEMNRMRESFLNTPTHAIIRYMDNSATNIVDLKDIQKGLWDFRHDEDFDEYEIYKTKAAFESDKMAKNIQILAIGQLQDCNEKLQSFMQISHALVRQIKKDKSIIIDIKQIEEFEDNLPETENAFTPQKPYVFKDKTNHKKVGVEIYSLGNKKKLIFECLRTMKRFAKKKFTQSDIELIEGAPTKQVFSTSSAKKKGTGQPGTGNKLLKNRKSLDKKKLVLNKTRIMRINSDSSSSDDDSVTSKKTKDPNNNMQCNGNKEDEDVEALNLRLPENSVGVSPMHSPTGSNLSIRRRGVSPMHSPTGSNLSTRRRLFDDDNRQNVSKSNCRREKERSSRQRHFHRSHKETSLSNANHHTYRKNKPFSQKRKFTGRNLIEPHYKVPRVRKSDEEEFYNTYWSDSSIGEREYSIFEEWNDYHSENETSTDMIHLGWNHSIPTKSWRHITKSKNPSLFTKRISRCLWKDEIINKCIELKDYYMKTVTDKPRTEVTPSKMKALHQCLKYWILVYHGDWLYSQDINEILEKLEHYLGEEIAYQIKEYERANNPRKEKKKKKTWRDS